MNGSGAGAASSVVLKKYTAEGASGSSRKEKMRFYRKTRRSVAETAAGPDVPVAARIGTERRIAEAVSAGDDNARKLTGPTRLLAATGP